MHNGGIPSGLAKLFDYVDHEIQGVSKRDLQWYSKCYCVASVTKTFTLKGVQTIHCLSQRCKNVVAS
jgi:hypothetical protein